MKKAGLCFFAILFVATIFATPPTDWMYLVNGTQFGLITKTTTYDDMINLFGKENLKDETRSGPEGEGEIKCTIVYEGKDLEMVVYWKDKGWHKRIASVESTAKDSPYHTKDSLKIGSTLTDLLKINKAAIKFYGFGWDYGGLIISYNKGKLEKTKVAFALDWNGGNNTALLGDSEFSSTMAKVKKQAGKITIAKMSISFP